jgi:hypothetical protein
LFVYIAALRSSHGGLAITVGGEIWAAVSTLKNLHILFYEILKGPKLEIFVAEFLHIYAFYGIFENLFIVVGDNV